MLTPETTQRLQTEANIWLATVRPDGQPHLVPLWFAWHEGQIFLCTRPGSIKMRNLAHNPLVALSLESGTSPLICEGRAALIPHPGPPPYRPSSRPNTTGTSPPMMPKATASSWPSPPQMAGLVARPGAIPLPCCKPVYNPRGHPVGVCQLK